MVESIGAIKFIFFVYFMCIVVSVSVAWIILLLSLGINKQRKTRTSNDPR